jgi:acyl carrier protein
MSAARSAPDPRRCHEPDAEPEGAPMPLFEVGSALEAHEAALLARVAEMIHQIDPNIPAEAVQADRTLWELGYDSLALVALRVAIRRELGVQADPLHWLEVHEERPRIGCFVRFLAASGVRA